MPVFRFVKDLLGRKEGSSAPISVDLEELPALIEDEAVAIGARAGPACERPAREVRQAVVDLGAVLERLEQADWNTALHPKLEQISRTTLPAFVRALESCLSRPLPDDPHEFYGAATALLKCSISALRGQGRYLRAVLPDEMKVVKAGVDVIGHAVNSMTAALGEEKRELAALEALRHRIERLGVLEAEEQDAIRRTHEAAAELEALAGERTNTEAELEAVNRSPAALKLDERKAEAGLLRARATSIEAAHRAQAQVLIQILRRSERLVAKRGDRQTSTRLHHLQSALAEPLPSDSTSLSILLAGGLDVVRDLVAAGEIAPKEGDPLFDDPAAVAASIAARVDDHNRVVEEAVALERELAASPVAQDRERLAGRLRQFEHRAAVLEDERAGLNRVAEQKAKERAALFAGLEEEVEAVFAGRVRLAARDA
ncbi:MAG: hypothetical protein ABFC89_03855 [Methanospirillum sp.]